jgi:hypothetical protein
MNEDLEKKVLQETGVSGAALGALSGAAIGAAAGVATEGAESLLGGRKFDAERAKEKALVGGIAGGVTGGYIGYQKGRREGEKLVSAAMSRDNVNNLLKGAQAYNDGLKKYNAGLRSKIAAAKKEPDASRRKSLKSLEREAKGQLVNADNRIAMRSKGAGNLKWDLKQRQAYNRTVESLTTQRNSLQKQVDTLAKLRTEGVY